MHGAEVRPLERTADIPNPTEHPPLPAPNVLLNASPDFRQRGVLLIKPSHPFLNASHVEGATSVTPFSVIQYPRNVNPRSIRPMNVVSGCCSTRSFRSVSLAVTMARRGLQRVGAKERIGTGGGLIREGTTSGRD
jgi:hypothetical protein